MERPEAVDRARHPVRVIGFSGDDNKVRRARCPARSNQYVAYTLMHTPARAHIYTHGQVHKQTHARTHAHTHMHTHTHTHTYTYTRTHKHTSVLT